MIVLHGSWADDRLVLWGEDGDEPAEPSKRPGRPPAVQDHPYAAEPDLLAKLLDVDSAWTGTTVLTLDSAGRGPRPSPELRAVDATGAPRRWHVPTLEVDVDTALALLLRDDPPDGCAYAVDGRLLVALAGFADDLARRGRVLPGVRALEGRGRALWLPVLAGADAKWLRAAAHRPWPSSAKRPTRSWTPPYAAGSGRRVARPPVPGPTR